MLKVILSLERGVIPGNPTFISPNPKIDFDELRILPSRYTTEWPLTPFRRASVNSFGYGGSNVHVVVDEAPGPKNHLSSYTTDIDDLFAEEERSNRPHILVLSANDEHSLRNQFAALDRHLSDPAVKLQLRDLAYTLSERRSRHYHRGFMLTDCLQLDIQALECGTVSPEPPKIGLVFTGQGAQWPEMGRDLLEHFPVAAHHIRYLDHVLRQCPHPPTWSLFGNNAPPPPGPV